MKKQSTTVNIRPQRSLTVNFTDDEGEIIHTLEIIGMGKILTLEHVGTGDTLVMSKLKGNMLIKATPQEKDHASHRMDV